MLFEAGYQLLLQAGPTVFYRRSQHTKLLFNDSAF